MRPADFWKNSVISGMLLVLLLPGLTSAATRSDRPVFGPISFTTDLEWETERVLSSGHKFPYGVLYLCAYWSYRDATPGTAYQYTWYRGSSVVEEGQATLPSASGEAKLYFRGTAGYGPEPGAYTLVIQSDRQSLASSSSALVAPTDNGGGAAARCGPLYFRRGFSESSTRIMMGGSRYAQGTKEVIAQWTCRNMRVGSPYRTTWTQGNKEFYRDEGIIDYDMTGWGPPLANADGSPLAPGRYRLTFTVDGQVSLAGEITVEGLGGFSTQPYFGQIAFTSEFDEAQDRPLDVGSEFKQGVKAIYVFWPYRDVPANAHVTTTWRRDGEIVDQSESTFGSAQGTHWTVGHHTDGSDLNPGVYQATVEVNGEVVMADACVILPAEGGASSTSWAGQKEFGPVSFASALDANSGEPLNPSLVFHYGITQLYAYWPHPGASPGDKYQYTWYHDGEYLDSGSGAFDEGASAAWQRLQYTNRMPLNPGDYEIRIDIGGRTLLTGQCMILDSDGPVYGPVVFSSGFDDADKNPLNIGQQFEYGVLQVYAYWAFHNAPVGKSYRSVWYLDGAPIHQEQDVFEFTSGRAWLLVARTDGTPLKRGVYTFNVLVDDAVVVADQCVVK